MNLVPVSFWTTSASLSELVAYPLEDGPVDVGPGVHVAEADDGALGVLVVTWASSRAGASAPCTRRYVPDDLVEHHLRGHAAFLGLQGLPVAELLLEPGDHPEAAEDEHLDVPGVRDARLAR